MTTSILSPGLNTDIAKLWNYIKENCTLPAINSTIVYKVAGIGRVEVYNNQDTTLTVCFYPHNSTVPNQFDIFPIIERASE